MKKQTFIVNYETYIKYVENNNTNKLHRWAEIYTPTKSLPTELIEHLKLNEIFENLEDFDIIPPIKYACQNIPDEYNYEYSFITKSGNEYRVDFVKLTEIQPTDEEKVKLTKKEKEIKKSAKNPLFYKQYIHDERLINKIYVSVSYSIKNATDENYDKVTKKNEALEVLNKTLYIIKYFVNENNEYIYMFADPLDDKKMDVYEYMIDKCFPGYEIVCDYTSGFNKTNIGYYLIK